MAKLAPTDPPAGARILLVDDSTAVRGAVERLLRAEGWDVLAADSGEQAFERAIEQPFDLVVTDLTMGALSGVQLCRLLRSDTSTASVPIVMMTASNDPRSRFWSRNAGADAYITKEDIAASLASTVRELLTRQPGRLATGTFRLNRSAGPMARLAEVLDDLLFEAVVSTEVRKLMDSAQDRETFARAVVGLASELSTYAYLALRLDGPTGTTVTLHARGPFPDHPHAHALATLGIDVDPGWVEILNDGPVTDGEGGVDSGEMAFFPIEAGGERLGELRAYGGQRRIGATDTRTLTLCARDLGLVAKSVFLVEQTQLLAHTDGLTGLANRRRCVERLQHEVARARRQRSALAVAVCDIDHFKSVNDRFGHNIGDAVIRHVAESLATSVRNIDMVGRWGGEEFLVILPNASVTGGRIVGERMRGRLDASAPPGGPDRVTVSIGIASFEPDDTPDTLVDRADAALYRAKERGRNRVEVDASGAGFPAVAAARD